MKPAFRWQTYCLLFLLVVSLALFYVGRHDLDGRYQAYLRSDEQVRAAREQCEQLRRDLETARQRVEHLGNDPLEIEAAIRRTKNLVREGEKVYRIKQVPNGAHGEAETRLGGDEQHRAPLEYSGRATPEMKGPAPEVSPEN